MKGSVEAGDGGCSRKELAHRGDARQRARQVQRRKVGDGDEVADDLGIDAHRRRVPRPTVHDAVADRLDAFHPAHRGGELRRIEPAAGDLELAVDKGAVVVVDQAHLE